jgi:hypothetical protein
MVLGQFHRRRGFAGKYIEASRSASGKGGKGSRIDGFPGLHYRSLLWTRVFSNLNSIKLKAYLLTNRYVKEYKSTTELICVRAKSRFEEFYGKQSICRARRPEFWFRDRDYVL